MPAPVSTDAPEASPSLQLYRRKEAAALLRLSERTLFTLDKAGELKSLRVGGSPRYRVVDLEAYLAKLAAKRDAQ
jgi:excisionase family DNA binding protein